MSSWRPLRILVVDDNDLEKHHLSTVLRLAMPYVSIDWATTFSEAQAKMGLRKALGLRYDAVLADMYLGFNENSGADLLLNCLARGGKDSRTALVLMSSSTQDAVLRECKHGRLFRFLNKPLLINDLRNLAANLFLSTSTAP